ncbi:copper resistance protein B [Sulfurimonas sp. SAG-AH-194-C20]|nr:copper resistance protein B [Sulfurimonas sp. SAG-AH-194-C20]MDF1878094.1 copper resistance protein B [Sulfurimonas sp. SAG-AH-194-C20]
MKSLLKKLLTTSLFCTSVFAGGGGDILRTNVLFDNLEYQFNNEKIVNWDMSGYVGYDRDKLYIYSEGEKPDALNASSENQLLYSRAIAPFWDIQAGIDYDKSEVSSKTWGVIALSGLAPYFFESRVVVLVDDKSNVGLRVDLEYEALITQKLILTPSFALDAYTKDELAFGIGSGLSNITLGARLRYEIRREFAPYIGVEWNKNFGNTNKISPQDSSYFVSGIRFWF